MQTRVLLATAALLAAATVAPATGWGQGTPSSDQIVRSLTPTSTTGATRGIRMAPVTPGAAGASSTANASATAPVHVPPPAASRAAPSVSLSVLFATGSADLLPEAVRVLDSLGKALNDQTLAAYRFRIEGHTDTVGSRDENRSLSDRRAAAVVEYLAANYHIDRTRVQAIGMGEDGLLVPTPDQTPEPRNRRVQVVNIGS
ncbi:MAG: OmpA family protein [Acetobacteraceae bacterium]